MTELLFSVVIPTYNRAELLKRALNSLVAQTYKDFEVIVCDDGSTDNTREVVDSFQKKLNITYIWSGNWGGPARPRNAGIKASRSEWICFLDSDDTYLPEKLENIAKYISNYDVIYHDLIGLDVSRDGGEIHKPIFDYLLYKATGSLITSSVSIRKSILNKVNGMEEHPDIRTGAEDYDLYLKIAKVTDRFKYIPMELGEYHLVHDNLHYDVYAQYTGTMYVLNKYIDYPSSKIAMKYRRLHYFPYLAVYHKNEAIKIFYSIISFNFSFFAGAILLITPAVVSKAFMKLIVKKFFTRYSYIVD